MRPKTTIAARATLILLALGMTLALISWDYKQGEQYKTGTTDTIPKNNREKKIRDLDDVLDEVNSAQLKIDMGKIQEQINDALKSIDSKKMNEEIDNALRGVDAVKIKQQINESLANVNWEQIKGQLEKLKDMDVYMNGMKEELQRIGPKIEKEMAKVKVDLEKLKAEIKEYKEFVNQLDKDGLINKNEPYTIRHKDGELIINDKKVSAETYSKYRNFLDDHKRFTIEKDKDDFDLDMD